MFEMTATVKLYRVTFNEYTNYMHDTVARYTDKEGKELSLLEQYLHIPKTGLIIREDELNQYKEYGNGFSSIQIVGEMYIR